MLVNNIKRAKALAERALFDLEGGNYFKTEEYSGVFKDGREQYKMNDHDVFDTETQAIFSEFAEWIAEWEL